MRVKQHRPRPIKTKYKRYSHEDLISAYKCVKENGMAVRTAARLHQVPENTLRARVIGRVAPDTTTTGPDPLFNKAEEERLVNHYRTMASYGYVYTRQEFASFATKFAIQLGKRSKSRPLSLCWYRNFRSRWPEFKVLKPQGQEQMCFKVHRDSVVDEYFDKLEECLSKHGLMDKPHLIFNVEETRIEIDTGSQTANSSPGNSVPGKRKVATLLASGSAVGQTVPPYFVFSGKKMCKALLAGASPGVSGTVTDTGSSSGDVFKTYIQSHFLKFVPGRTNETILLLLDRHKTQVPEDVVEWAKDNNIIICFLPAHACHAAQPLDVECFDAFEKMLAKKCQLCGQAESQTVVTRRNVCQLVCSVYSKVFSTDNLQSAFRKGGVFPLNRDTVIKKCMISAGVSTRTAETEATADGMEEEPMEVSETGSKDNPVVLVEAGVKNTTQKTAEVLPDIFLQREQLQLSRWMQDDEVHNSRRGGEQKSVRKQVKQQISKSTAKGKHKEKVPLSDDTDTDNNGVSIKEEIVSEDENVSDDENTSDDENVSDDENSDDENVSGEENASDEENSDDENASGNESATDDENTSDDESAGDEEKCCKCGLWTPKELSGTRTLAQWAQCDGTREGQPCNHWTHLKYCTSLKVIKKTDSFFCHHCAELSPPTNE